MELIGLNLTQLGFGLIFMLFNALLTGLVIAGVLILAYYLFIAKGKQGERKSAEREQDSR